MNEIYPAVKDLLIDICLTNDQEHLKDCVIEVTTGTGKRIKIESEWFGHPYSGITNVSVTKKNHNGKGKHDDGK